MDDLTIEATDLSKSFGPRTAVRNLSLTARRGDVVGLLGPNGSGKTTTIRLLTTILEPDSGTFTVAGVPSTRPTEIRRRIGVLPESSGYPGHQTGREFLRYHARLFDHPRDAATAVADRLLAEVGLADRAGSRISTYSRGMRQRLGIARALVNDPTVVFLDEPTLGLDPAGQRQVLDMVRRIARDRGATVVLSTHTLPEVEDVCTDVVILSAGSVLRAGPMGSVLATVGVHHSGQLRVPVEHADRARAALAAVPGVTVEASDGRPDVLGLGSGEREGMNAALQAVLAAGVPVLAFEVEGARLSTAFLSLTGSGSGATASANPGGVR
jgi:ABC-2 type transport system ATP-binding protein